MSPKLIAMREDNAGGAGPKVFFLFLGALISYTNDLSPATIFKCHMSSKLIAMREQNARGASRRGSHFASQTLASSSTQSISNMSFSSILHFPAFLSSLLSCKSGPSIIFDPFFIF